MGENTRIEWCTHTFNAWEGCTKVGPGCDHCYAETRNVRYHRGANWGPGAPRLLRSDAYWREPLKWNERAMLAGIRARVFCSSLADVFDNEAPEGQRARLWRLIEATPHLDWLLLTKRIGNALKMLPDNFYHATYPNVWLGATVVTQEEADRDIPKLLAIPAAIRFLSCEPLLGPIDLRGLPVNWVIVGGESGAKARPFNLQWARELLEQCEQADVPCFVKQLGARPFLKVSRSVESSGPGFRLSMRSMEIDQTIKLRDRKGGDMAEWPDDLRVREFPRSAA